MRIKTTKVFQMNEEALKQNKLIVIHQGSSRSSKTYNILIWFIVHTLTDWNNEIIDIFRKTFPSLRTSVMFDFFEILKNAGLYNENDHNKTENTYKIGTNLFRFGSVDQEQKVRGSGRTYLFINEANELTIDEFRQLNQRTTKMTFLDYNPSDEFGWFYDLETRDDVAVYHTTYKDNPFITDKIRKEIEYYQETDENYWRIFGLGLRGYSQTTIYTKWNYWDKEFKDFEGEELFGLDFGYNHPTGLLRVKYNEKEILFDELLYKTNLTSDLIVNELNELVKQNKLKKTDKIIADCSRPEIINELYNAGFNVHPTIKGKDSVLRGINFIKKHKIYITKESLNLLKEIKSYKWKVDKNNKTIDEPVKIRDDLMDCMRYALEDKSEELPPVLISKVRW